MLIGDTDIARLVIHGEQAEEDKLRDREEFQNKKVKTTCRDNKKLEMQTGHLFNKIQLDLLYHMLVHLHQRTKCGQAGHSMRECPKNRKGSGNGGNRTQSSSATLRALPDNVAPRGATSGTDERANHLYATTSHQEQKKSPDVVTSVPAVSEFPEVFPNDLPGVPP
ncbi:uncharacterized protein LOC125837334 [Solanum verrucosum]|uniref:uncharacterized protein LOC125837334 n=1 Tax=Solanum verrucosum TaxID=315347 RepID=UPI0020CFF059|nr:uncharacterized protein LOC125837334 [Solanum verrucosum]